MTFEITSRSSTRVMVGGILWLGMMQFFIAQLVAQSAWPGYSARDLDISYLGISSCGPFTDPATGAVIEACSPLHGAISIAFIAMGLLTMSGAVASIPAWPSSRRRTVGLALMIVAGLGTLMSGVWGVDVNAGAHGLGAVIYFVLGNIAIILLGTTMLERSRPFAAYSLVSGGVSLFAFALFVAQVDPGLGRGTIERIAGYPSTIWFLVTGALLVGEAASSRHLRAAG